MPAVSGSDRPHGMVATLPRVADRRAFEAAIEAGLLLSAGGSGRASVGRHRRTGEAALAAGTVTFTDLSQLAPEARILVATAVGAPGHAGTRVEPRDCVEAARLMVERSGATPAGVIPGHVPGLYAWLQAAVLGVPVVDAAANGRGHPTVKMGGMGLAGRPEVSILQAASGGRAEDGTLLRVVAEGSMVKTSNIMRQAAVQNGGLIMAARGPHPASFVRRHGAVGAISYQLALGEAMRQAGDRGDARIRAILDFTRGRLLGIGRVTASSVRYRDGFDAGEVRVDAREGELVLSVCNEYMAAAVAGERVATFPDLIATVDPRTGETLAISELGGDRDVAVLVTSKRHLPLGAGVWDASVYPEVEERMGIEIARFALDPEA